MKKKQPYLRHFFYLIIIAFSFGCNSKADKNESEVEKRKYLPQANPVEIMVLKRSDFKKELISNGRLKARRKSILKFRISEELLKLHYRNGDHVNKGAIIAELNAKEREAKVRQSEIALEKAKLELADFLMSHGGLKPEDSTKIPSEFYEIGMISSGYKDALFKLQSAQNEYESCFLKAPFAGKIANIKYKTYEQVSAGEDFCTLIDDRQFEVEFHLLETELKEIRKGKPVKIIPFSLDTVFTGVVNEINPMVDDKGLVTVKALVRNSGSLLEGMNVKIFIESIVPDQLVVPREAVVLRQNQEVLFKVINHKAYWTYVQSLYENSTSYAVIAHPEKGATLAPGDTVIISGNLNLAHESEIEIRK